MLLDFCDGRLDPVIFCDKVSADGHEVDNLISTDARTRNKGFIAESFINPPVNIRVVFPCNIQIYRIVINPVVGRQKSTGFEIFTCCSFNTDSKVKKCRGQTDSQLQNCSGQSSTCTSGELFLPVGRVMLNDPSVICFQSVHFRITDQWRPDNIPEADHYPVQRDLRHQKVGYLNCVSQVTIRINRTVGGSVPCIRRLEIWGKPPTSCPQHLNDKIRRILFPSSASLNIQSSSGEINEGKSSADHGPVIHEDHHISIFENGVDIPEDFIDCITCDMMTIPMLLPCGRNIDQSTLEKHISAEASWGRPACDPFTGVLFDNKHFAIPNSHLKSRIDQFLLKHTESLKHLPRTLGNSDGQGPAPSRLVQLNSDTDVDNKETSSKINKAHKLLGKSTSEKLKSLCNPGTSNLVNLVDQNSCLNVQSDVSQKRFKRKHFQSSDFDENIPTPTSSSERTAFELNGPPEKKLHHEDSLQQSLDSALCKTLGNLPTFRKSSLTSICKTGQENNPTESSILHTANLFPDITCESSDVKSNSDHIQLGSNKRPENIKCENCNEVDASAWFKMACGHVYCRNCVSSVTSSKSMECHQCHKICSKSDIMRVYLP